MRNIILTVVEAREGMECGSCLPRYRKPSRKYDVTYTNAHGDTIQKTACNRHAVAIMKDAMLIETLSPLLVTQL